MSADGSHTPPQRASFATGRISKTRPWTDDNPALERAYTQGGGAAAKAALPWRSLAAISRQAHVLGLRAPDHTTLARLREDATLDRKMPSTSALDTPLTPRDSARIILSQAGAPMVPRAVADRLRLPLKDAAALLQAMADDGEIITVAVGDRQGLITLRHMPETTATDSLRAARHHGSRIAPHTGRTPRHETPAHAVIVAALREAPRTIDALCALAGLRYSTVRAHLSDLGATSSTRPPPPAQDGRRQRKANLYTLPKDTRQP